MAEIRPPGKEDVPLLKDYVYDILDHFIVHVCRGFGTGAEVTPGLKRCWKCEEPIDIRIQLMARLHG